MKALVYHGVGDVRTETVTDPKIMTPHDVILKVSTAAICGSDLHLFDLPNPFMKEGDILGHEFMGEVVEVGAYVKKLKKGDRIVVPFCISCGECFFCKNDMWSLCDNSNPEHKNAEMAWGYSTAGLFGYSHFTGGYAGGQAEFRTQMSGI